jgi:hypothetical protein
MPRIHQFFPTWHGASHWGAAIATGAAAAAVVVPFATDDGAFRRVLLAVLGLALVTGLLAIVLRFASVKVTSEGVMAARGFGVRSRLVRWQEIKAVVPTTASGLRQLRLVHDSPFPEQVTMLMHLDNVSTLHAFVETHAGKQHPLTVWLSGEMSASNKSLERTREG